MTLEQKSEFEKIAEQEFRELHAASWAGLDGFDRGAICNAMKAAHNAAVRKCAETVRANIIHDERGPAYSVPVISKDSILKNLIP